MIQAHQKKCSKFSLKIRATNNNIPELKIKDIRGDISIQDLKRKIADLHPISEIFADQNKPPRYFFAGNPMQGPVTLEEYINNTMSRHLNLDHIEETSNFVDPTNEYTITLNTSVSVKTMDSPKGNEMKKNENVEMRKEYIEEEMVEEEQPDTLFIESDEEEEENDQFEVAPVSQFDLDYHVTFYVRLLIGSAILLFTILEEKYFSTLIRTWGFITGAYIFGVAMYYNMLVSDVPIHQQENETTSHVIPEEWHQHVYHLVKLYICTLYPDYEIRPLPRTQP